VVTPTSPHADDRAQVWTAPQRRVLLIVLTALWIGLAVRYARSRAYVADPQPAEPARAHDLADRIDPNTADWATLAALPTIGEKRAKDVVAYREQYQASHPGGRPFTAPNDLLRIRGFGPATVATLEPYLIFPPTPTAQP
jgi:DNA uptake protein ComE-like DNA-binding protein